MNPLTTDDALAQNREMRGIKPLTPKERAVAQCLQGVDDYDENDKRFLMEQLGLCVTDLNPPAPVEPRPTLSQLLRERAWEMWATVWAAVWGTVWAPFGYAWSLLFCTAPGLAVLKIAAVVVTHVFVWAAWTAVVGPVPRAALYLAYNAILSIVLYAWLFCHQLPCPPTKPVTATITPAASTAPMKAICRCGKSHHSAEPAPRFTPDFRGKYAAYNDIILKPHNLETASHYKDAASTKAKGAVEVPITAKGPVEVPITAKGPVEVPITAKAPVEVPAKAMAPVEVPAKAMAPVEVPAKAKTPADPKMAAQLKQAREEVESLRFQAMRLRNLMRR